MLSAAGAALFGVLFAAAPARRTISISLGAGLAAGAALLALQARSLADSVAAVPTVLAATWFGHVLAAQLVALALAALLHWWGAARPALAACWLAAALQPLHLHGWAMEGRVGPLVACELLHLLAAGTWLGGLLPLALTLRAVPPAAGAVLARRFSWLGVVCTVALAGSAAYQGTVLLGGARGLFETAYGWTALGKTGLFAVLLAMAARHRLRLVPRIFTSGDSGAMQRALARSVAAEAAVGLLLVLLAALLASLPPAMDMGDA